MSVLKRAVLAAGLAMLGYLLWRLDAAETLGLVLQVRWLFVPILLQELGAHAFNALGWRLAFRPEDAAALRFTDLLRFRVMGDGVNYLTPSATIAGEFARAGLLGDAVPLPVRVNGVVAAKFAQALAQLAFILSGLGWAVGGAVPAFAPYAGAARWGCAALLGGLAGLGLLARRRKDPAGAHPPGWRGWVSRLPADLLAFAGDHPARAAAATACFVCGYAWNAGEAWLIARALGVPLGWAAALRLEVLSNLVDALLFMVPAKAGTQEAGKTFLFTVMGLSPRAGLAFGLVRHARELGWAALGLAAYAAHERARRDLSAPGSALPHRG